MQPASIVEQFDVPRNILLRRGAGRILGAIHELDLKCPVRGLREGVVETDPGPSDRPQQFQLSQRVPYSSDV